ncbi:MAG: glucose-6-phosphate isomerase family protein [Patescibacteria group bacterium]
MENFCTSGKLEHKEGYDVCRNVDERGELRYDLTLIYPTSHKILPRTFGHYHTIGYVELFEVINGKTFIIMQKEGVKPDIIEEIYIIESGEGEKIVILQNFGFCNINPQEKEELLISNWISKSVENIYQDIKDLDGFCYLAKRDGNGKVFFEKNKNYKQIPELVRLKPKSLPIELENLDFLINPSKYSNLLTVNNLYEKI